MADFVYNVIALAQQGDDLAVEGIDSGAVRGHQGLFVRRGHFIEIRIHRRNNGLYAHKNQAPRQ
jgi:hypothetical protein